MPFNPLPALSPALVALWTRCSHLCKTLRGCCTVLFLASLPTVIKILSPFSPFLLSLRPYLSHQKDVLVSPKSYHLFFFNFIWQVCTGAFKYFKALLRDLRTSFVTSIITSTVPRPTTRKYYVDNSPNEQFMNSSYVSF